MFSDELTSTFQSLMESPKIYFVMTLFRRQPSYFRMLPGEVKIFWICHLCRKYRNNLDAIKATIINRIYVFTAPEFFRPGLQRLSDLQNVNAETLKSHEVGPL